MERGIHEQRLSYTAFCRNVFRQLLAPHLTLGSSKHIMWRFRKSFSPLPGVRLTLSPSGISTSVGVGPFRVTAGPRGQHFTATVPGTGLSFRQSLSGGQALGGGAHPPPRTPQYALGAAQPRAVVPRVEQIESAGSAVLTTPGIAEFRKLLDRARTEHAHIAAELTAAKSSERVAKGKYLSWKSGWLFRRLMKSRFAALEAAAEESTARRVELEEQEELARLSQFQFRYESERSVLTF